MEGEDADTVVVLEGTVVQDGDRWTEASNLQGAGSVLGGTLAS